MPASVHHIRSLSQDRTSRSPAHQKVPWSRADRSAPSLPAAAHLSAATMVEEVIGCKWTVRLLWHLADGPTRPSRLLKACPGLSTKVMNERLRKLMRFGLLDRHVHGDKPPVVVEYRLTSLGKRFLRVLAEVKKLQAALDANSTRAQPS